MSFIRRSVERYKGWPKWVRIAAPAALALFVIGTLGGGGAANTPPTKGPAKPAQVIPDGPSPTSTMETPPTTSSAPPTKEETGGGPTTTLPSKSSPPITNSTTTTRPPAPPSPPGSGSGLLTNLRIAPEDPRTGYRRELFVHWIDADGDGCDTRREVLIVESRVPAQVGPGCSVIGEWFSAYDGASTNDPSTFDIDHVVALAEVWDSGASGWDQGRRRDFANDLGFEGSLIAVTASSNRSKSDSDPAQWLPPRREAWCSFATDWVRVKIRWDLTADEAEVGALQTALGACNGSPAPTPPPPAPAPTTTVPPPEGASQATLTSLDCAGERVTITNTAAAAIDLTGWSIHDEGTKHTFNFPAGYRLDAGASVTVRSGGPAEPGELAWTGASVWNNDGDTAYLVTPAGAVASTRSC